MKLADATRIIVGGTLCVLGAAIGVLGTRDWLLPLALLSFGVFLLLPHRARSAVGGGGRGLSPYIRPAALVAIAAGALSLYVAASYFAGTVVAAGLLIFGLFLLAAGVVTIVIAR